MRSPSTRFDGACGLERDGYQFLEFFEGAAEGFANGDAAGAGEDAVSHGVVSSSRGTSSRAASSSKVVPKVCVTPTPRGEMSKTARSV